MAEPMRGWNDTINMSIFKRSLIKCYWIDTMFLYLWTDFYAINGNSRLVINLQNCTGIKIQKTCVVNH